MSADKSVMRVVRCRKEPYDVYIGRAWRRPRKPKNRFHCGVQIWEQDDSKWFNPFRIGRDGTREEVIAKYENWIRTQPKLLAALPELKGKVLGCWCAPKPCHGNVLIKLVGELHHGVTEGAEV